MSWLQVEKKSVKHPLTGERSHVKLPTTPVLFACFSLSLLWNEDVLKKIKFKNRTPNMGHAVWSATTYARKSQIWLILIKWNNESVCQCLSAWQTKASFVSFTSSTHCFSSTISLLLSSMFHPPPACWQQQTELYANTSHNALYCLV